jgi:predicted RNA-binding protein with RPS1 domain
MKRTLLLLTSIICSAVAIAQQAAESTVEALKAQQPCVTVSYNMNPDVVESALKQKLDNAKLGSGDKSKGYRVYKGVNLPDISPDKIDIYTKVEGKKENATVYFLVSKGYDNFISSKSDPDMFKKVMAYVNTLQADAVSYQLNLDIKAAEEEQAKAEKKYNNSVDDGKDLQSDKTKIEKKIEENKAEQEKLAAELEKAKAKLAELNGKKK